MSADVQPPDLETRTAILQRHALEAGLELPSDVIDYIAYNVKDNIRLLEGAFNKLLALHSVSRQTVDITFVQDALSDLIDNRARKSISASRIRDIVAEFYEMDTDLLIGKSRKRPIVDARQVAMHFCKQMTQHFFCSDHFPALLPTRCNVGIETRRTYYRQVPAPPGLLPSARPAAGLSWPISPF
ncbi:MAG: hypothetical protein EBR20_06765 [Bacteroidetes bacterium]|nr:hypothetical protein [Bacteroidota bacterium]